MLWTAIISAGGLITAGGGLWIAGMFVPSIAVMIKAALDFIKSPIGTALAIVALAVFVFLSGWAGGDIHGTTKTKAAWKADIAAKALAAAAREDALRKEMKAAADQAITIDGVFGKRVDNEVSSYVQQGVKRPECRATGDDIKRLLSIR